MANFKTVTIEKGEHFHDLLSIKDDGLIEYCETFFSRDGDGDRDDYIKIKLEDYSKKITFDELEEYLKNLNTKNRMEELRVLLAQRDVKFQDDFWMSF